MIREVMKGAVVAAAVCSMFSASAASAADKMEKSKTGDQVVQCSGVNSCKGSGSCKGADNACKGQNTCKGKGWTETKSAKECMDKGGSVASNR